MGGRGPAPADKDQRRRRNAPAAGEWKTLPPGREGRAPRWPLPLPLPAEKPEVESRRLAWVKEQRRLWKAVWSKPQATEWEGAGLDEFVARWVLLTIEVGSGRLSLPILQELRQIEDRLGLNPKGMQDRRWRLGDPEPDEVKAEPGDATVSRLEDRRRRLTGAS